MKSAVIDVACAVIVGDDGRVFAARRPHGKALAGKWEFPGGKIEAGESSRDALVREIHEELQTGIRLLAELPVVSHKYGHCCIRLHPWICGLDGPSPEPTEHDAIVWLEPSQLPGLDWAEADIPIVDYLPGFLARTAT